MKQSFLQRMSVLGVFSLLVAVVLPLILASVAEAAGNFQQVMVRPDRLKATTATTGLICAKPQTVATEATVDVTFPSDFTLGAFGTFTVTTTNLPNGASAWVGIGTATAKTSQTVTFPSGELVVGTLYCFNWDSSTAVSTGSAGNNKVGTIATFATGPTAIDTANYATSIVSSDLIVVSAVVPALFTFALSGNTDSFTTDLSTSSVVSTSGKTATITTNADSGWVAWVKSANAALNSAGTGATIATAGSLDNAPTDLSGTTGYVLDVDITTDSGSGLGTVTQAANYGGEYAGTDTNSGGTLSTTFQPIAASDGTTGGDVLTLIERAKVTTVQAAATDYTDTLTVVAAGRF